MRLIDADALCNKYISNRYKSSILIAKTDYAQGARDIIEDIIDAPTIEPVERGKWEREPGDIYGSMGLRCTRCGALKDSIYESYCPNCGALMEVKVPTIEDFETGRRNAAIDLISRRAAIKELIKCGDYYNGNEEAKRGVSQCIGIIYDMPSALEK